MDVSVYISIAGVVVSALVSFIVASMQIGEYKNKVDNNCTDITEIKREQKEVRDKVIACETSLKEREPYTKRKSPISLTDRGQAFLSDSGGQKYIDEHLDKLFEDVEEKKPKTAYDVQEFSREVVQLKSEEDEFNPLKEFLFKEGLDKDDLVVVMGIYLRDLILEKKNWNVADIDKQNPQK